MRETLRNIQKNPYNNLQKNVVSSIKIEVVLFSFVLPKNNITTSAQRVKVAIVILQGDLYGLAIF